MTIERNESGYYVAAVACNGKSRCRISMNSEFQDAEEAERALAVKVRGWIAEYLARGEGRTTGGDEPEVTV
tara:strand:- start:550 stop:762 length:213 start_codon:yes stop_codon:yes gene_type:complete